MDDDQRWCETYCAAIQAYLGAAQETPLDAEILGHGATCPACRARLLALFRALGAAPGPADPIDCARCEADLAPFIDAERRDPLQAMRRYRHVWNHLWTCVDCLELYDMINETLDDPTIFRSPKQQRAMALADWARQGLLMAIDRDEIRWSLPPDALRGAVRRSSGGGQDAWFEVLPPTRSLDERFTVSVDIRAGEGDRWTVAIRLDPPPAGELVVEIGAYRAQAALADGNAQIEVPDPDLINEEPGALRITLLEA